MPGPHFGSVIELGDPLPSPQSNKFIRICLNALSAE